MVASEAAAAAALLAADAPPPFSGPVQMYNCIKCDKLFFLTSLSCANPSHHSKKVTPSVVYQL